MQNFSETKKFRDISLIGVSVIDAVVVVGSVAESSLATSSRVV